MDKSTRTIHELAREISFFAEMYDNFENQSSWKLIEKAPHDGLPILAWDGKRLFMCIFDGVGWCYDVVNELYADATHWVDQPPTD